MRLILRGKNRVSYKPTLPRAASSLDNLMQTTYRRFIWLTAFAIVTGSRLHISLAQSVDEMQLLPPIGTSHGNDSTPMNALASPTVPSHQKPPFIPHWFTDPVWKFGAELGLNGSEGNAQAFSILAGANGKRETEGNVFEGSLKYGKTQSQGIETQHFALVNSRWDWKFTPGWLLYNKNTFEYDEFKAFDVRLAFSGGFGQHLIVKTETKTLTGRFGAGTSREIGGPDNRWIPEANFGVDFERQLTARQKVKLTSDYYPSWENYHDFRLVTDAFWEIQLDETVNLSLKLGMISRYDSTPNGLKSNDIDYFATLMWKR